MRILWIQSAVLCFKKFDIVSYHAHGWGAGWIHTSHVVVTLEESLDCSRNWEKVWYDMDRGYI